MDNIRVAKVYEDAKMPVRENPSDAGLDLYTYLDLDCENEDEDTEKFREIVAGSNLVVGTGIKVAIPHGYVGLIQNKSGIASEENLMVGACVIDSGYEGEIFVDIHNTNPMAYKSTRTGHCLADKHSNTTLIYHGQKIAQLIIQPVETPVVKEVTEDSLYQGIKTDSERGDGGFGSTGLGIEGLD